MKLIGSKGFLAGMAALLLTLSGQEVKAQCFEDSTEVNYANLGQEIESTEFGAIGLIHIKVAGTAALQFKVEQGETHSVKVDSKFEQEHQLQVKSATRDGASLVIEIEDVLGNVKVESPSPSSAGSVVRSKASACVSAGLLTFFAQRQTTSPALVGTAALSALLLATESNAQCAKTLTLTLTLPATSRWKTTDILTDSVVNGGGSQGFIMFGDAENQQRKL